MPTRILIADDSDTVRNVIGMFLEQRSDVEICGQAANGLEAVEQAVRLRPDVIILDVVMPQMNGIEAASILRQRVPEAKTILFTMYGDYVQSLAVAAGVDFLVGKPDGMSSLLKAIDALAHKPPASQLLDSPLASPGEPTAQLAMPSSADASAPPPAFPASKPKASAAAAPESTKLPT